MFAWSGNRVKPKVKATYTRKKLLNPQHQTDKVNSMAPPTETVTMLGEVDNGSADNEGSIGGASMDLALPSKAGSKTQLVDSSATTGDEPSQPDDSSAVASAANAQVLLETATTIKEPSQDDEMEDAEEDEGAKDDRGEVFDVECFMADDSRKLPGMKTVQSVLLTKWVGFDKVSDLTWEPESEMREDVPHIVEAYYKRKGTAPSSSRSQEVTKTPRGGPKKGKSGSLSQPPKDSTTPRGRGRPRKVSKALAGSPTKVTKPSSGGPPKDGTTPRGRGRPRKVVEPEQEPKPKVSTGRRGRPRKVQSSEAEQK